MSHQNWVIATLLGLHISANAATVKVLDNNGQPVAGLTVAIGTAAGQPFADNQVTTDANGQFAAPDAWKEPLPVTIEGPDVVRTTHMATAPSVATLKISRADGDAKIELKGTLTDFGRIRTDGKVDAGVFIPALMPSQLVYFDVGWMISPEYDTLRVLGREMAIPSNIVLPRQQESYILPITLDKPTFRMFVRRPGHYRYLALHGQFPLKRAVDDIRAGVPAYNLVNHGTLIQSGLIDLDVTGPINNLSIPVNKMVFDNSLTVQAPPLTNSDIVLSVALTAVDDQGSLVPSDVKRLQSGQPQALRTPTGKSAPSAISVWLKEKSGNVTRMNHGMITADDMLALPMNLLYDVFQHQETQATATVNFSQFSLATHTQAGQAPAFLSHVNPPQVNGTTLTLTPPPVNQAVKPAGTLVLYSAIQFTGTGDIKTEQRTRLWEVWVPEWATSVTLPNLAPLAKTQADKFRWEVLYLGQDGESLTNVTRNAVDL